MKTFKKALYWIPVLGVLLEQIDLAFDTNIVTYPEDEMLAKFGAVAHLIVFIGIISEFIKVA